LCVLCLYEAILFDVIRNVQFITKKTNELIIRQGDQGDWQVSLFADPSVVITSLDHSM